MFLTFPGGLLEASWSLIVEHYSVISYCRLRKSFSNLLFVHSLISSSLCHVSCFNFESWRQMTIACYIGNSFASPVCSGKKLHKVTLLFFFWWCGYDFQGGKSSRARVNNNMIQEAAVDSPLSQLPSQTIEGEGSLSGQASEYEEAESGRKLWLFSGIM